MVRGTDDFPKALEGRRYDDIINERVGSLLLFVLPGVDVGIRMAPGRVRRATASDAPGIVDCLSSAFEAYRNDYEKNGFQSSGIVSDFYGMPLSEYVKVLK